MTCFRVRGIVIPAVLGLVLAVGCERFDEDTTVQEAALTEAVPSDSASYAIHNGEPVTEHPPPTLVLRDLATHNELIAEQEAERALKDAPAVWVSRFKGIAPGASLIRAEMVDEGTAVPGRDLWVSHWKTAEVLAGTGGARGSRADSTRFRRRVGRLFSYPRGSRPRRRDDRGDGGWRLLGRYR